MRLPPGILLKIASAIHQPGQRAGTMTIIIERPYAHLEEKLRRSFEGQEDVKIVVDRRYGERRTNTRPVPKDRRRSDQRNPKEEFIEVSFSD